MCLKALPSVFASAGTAMAVKRSIDTIATATTPLNIFDKILSPLYRSAA
jgi:hypothetical protein